MAVSERDAVDEHTMKFGLLMESAQAHQKLAEFIWKSFAHTHSISMG
jgi:malate synthase